MLLALINEPGQRVNAQAYFSSISAHKMRFGRSVKLHAGISNTIRGRGYVRKKHQCKDLQQRRRLSLVGFYRRIQQIRFLAKAEGRLEQQFCKIKEEKVIRNWGNDSCIIELGTWEQGARYCRTSRESGCVDIYEGLGLARMNVSQTG